MPTVGQDSLWNRWKKGVTSGWGNLFGNTKKGLEGNVQAPTVKNKGIVAGSAAAGTENAVSDVGGLITDLTDPEKLKHAAIRSGEVLVGTLLLIAGVDHIFGTNYTNKIAKVAPYTMV